MQEVQGDVSTLEKTQKRKKSTKMATVYASFIESFCLQEVCTDDLENVIV